VIIVMMWRTDRVEARLKWFLNREVQSARREATMSAREEQSGNTQPCDAPLIRAKSTQANTLTAGRRQARNDSATIDPFAFGA
jgi:hypothetical protein